MERITITEIPGVQLHGEVRVPVLEAPSDHSLRTIKVLQHVLIAV
jgi:hypothetical protein